MSAAALLGRLTAQGVALERDGDRLKIRAARPLKAKVLCELRERKAEILVLLESDAPDSGTQSTLHGEPQKTGTAAQSTLHTPDSETASEAGKSVSAAQLPDLEKCADGLLRRDGFIMPTRATMPAYTKYFAARSGAAFAAPDLSEIQQSTLLKSADNCRARWERALARGDHAKAAQWREVYESHLAALMAENEAQGTLSRGDS
jgi:hypothetical protein